MSVYQIGIVFPVTVRLIADAAIPPMNLIPALPPGSNDTTYPTMTAIWTMAPSAVNTVLWRLRAAYSVPPSEHKYTAAPGVGVPMSLLGPRNIAAPINAKSDPRDHSRANLRAYNNSNGA